MLGLQEMLEKVMQEVTNPKEVLLQVLGRRLDELGVPLDVSQKANLAEQIMESADGVIHVAFEDEQIGRTGLREPKDIESLLRNVIEGLGPDIEEYTEMIERDLPWMLLNVAGEIAPIVLDSLRCRAPEMLSERRSNRELFMRHLSDTWGAALDLLEMHVVIAAEIGDYVNEAHRSSEAQGYDIRCDVLSRLHARACQISNEVLTLLECGFADGAHARWRSLHEVVVVADFIEVSGRDLAERYLSHEGVESYKAALQYRRYCEQLDVEPITDDEIAELSSNRDRLIQQYGPEYKHEYGWAAGALNKRRPTFADIEQAVGLDHLRPYYKLASHNVHANPKGVFVKLGLPDGADNLLLAGASDAGLAEPGHLMALSLTHITSVLLLHEPTLDTLVLEKMLLKLSREIGVAFSGILDDVTGRLHEGEGASSA